MSHAGLQALPGLPGLKEHLNDSGQHVREKNNEGLQAECA